MLSFRTLGGLMVVLALATACGSAGSSPGGGDDTGGAPDVAADQSQDLGPNPDGAGDAVAPDQNGDTATAPTVETAVSRTAVNPGETITVVCTIAPADRADKYETAVQVTGGPANGATVADHEVTFNAEGSYSVACTIVGSDVVDATPETVVVAISGPAAVDTAVAPNPVGAGEPATVTCTATDYRGEPLAWDAYTIQVVGPDGYELDGTEFSSTALGTYRIACAATTAGGPVIDATPVDLAVIAGPLARTAAAVSPDTLEAGEAGDVTCSAFDAYGNELEGFEYTLSADGGVTVDGLTVSATLVGDYSVSCRARYVDSEYTQDAATFEVVAGPVVGLTLTANPERPFYLLNAQVTLTPRAVDAYGNELPAGETEPVQVDPATGVEPVEGQVNKFRFVAEGYFTFSTRLVDEPTVTAELTLVCDQDPPVLVVEYPERGATLNGDQIVIVRGTVSDAVSGVAAITVNGQQAQLGADGAFSAPITSRQGMNLIDIQATDGASHAVRSFRSYYYSTVWYPMDLSNPAGAYVTNAIQAFLAAEVFDSADPEAVDLAGILEQILANLDIGAIIDPSQPVATQGVLWCDYDIFLTDLTFGTPSVSLAPFDGGLHLNVIIPNFQADLLLIADEFACPDIVGVATASNVTVTADLILQVAPDGQATAQMQNVVTTLSDDFAIELEGESSFGDDAVAWLLQGLIGLFQGTITDLIEQQVTDAILGFNDMLADVISMLNLDQQIDVDPFIGEGEPVVLNLKTTVSTLRFNQVGALLQMNGTILAEKRVDRDPLGSIGRARCLGPAEPFDLPIWGEGGAPLAPIEAAVAYDFANQGVFSLWYGGALNLVLGPADLGDVDLSQYGISNLAVTTNFWLPPILTTCTADRQFVLQLGDAYVDLVFDFALLGHVELGVFLEVEVAADAVVAQGEAGPEIQIVLGDFRVLEVEVVHINEEQADRQEQLVGVIKAAIPAILADQLGDSLSFAIPSFDLGSFSEMLPANTWLTFLPEVIRQESGNLLIGGRLARGTPPAEPGSGCGGGCETAPVSPWSALPLAALLVLVGALRFTVRRRARTR